MTNLRFDKNGNWIAQKVKVRVEHDEKTEDLIEEFICEKCNFRIEYNKNGDVEIDPK